LISLTSGDFLTIREWHREVLGSDDVILRHTSALEHLQLFNGYMSERKIDVYAKKKGQYENINYHVVDTYDGIDTICFGNIRCTSVNQTFNDMFEDFDHIDKQSLVEGLSGYYYSHGESFDGLSIKSENMNRFNSIKDWAIEYYSGG